MLNNQLNIPSLGDPRTSWLPDPAHPQEGDPGIWGTIADVLGVGKWASGSCRSTLNRGFDLGKPWENHGKTIGTCWFHGNLWDLPSGKRWHNYGTSPFLMGISTISMAIVHSHVRYWVKLPEGNMENDGQHEIYSKYTIWSTFTTKLWAKSAFNDFMGKLT